MKLDDIFRGSIYVDTNILCICIFGLTRRKSAIQAAGNQKFAIKAVLPVYLYSYLYEIYDVSELALNHELALMIPSLNYLQEWRHN